MVLGLMNPLLRGQRSSTIMLTLFPRYCFTLIANIFVFGCIWGLLEKFGSSITNDISEKDQNVFWVSPCLLSMGVEWQYVSTNM